MPTSYNHVVIFAIGKTQHNLLGGVQGEKAVVASEIGGISANKDKMGIAYVPHDINCQFGLTWSY